MRCLAQAVQRVLQPPHAAAAVLKTWRLLLMHRCIDFLVELAVEERLRDICDLRM